MSVESKFFEEFKEWSGRKLTLLTSYLKSGTQILGDLYYIDGFAGRGWYGKADGEMIPGSPIRAAQYAQTIKEQGRTYSLHCINIESDPENYSHLVRATEPYGDVTINLFGPFVDQIDELLRIVRDKPVLCFLDPFGIDGMDMSAIRRLVQRRGAKTDLWIRFAPNAVRRREGHFERNNPSSAKHYDVICRVYGIQDREELHRILDSPPTAEARRLAALRLYRDCLENLYIGRGKAFTGDYHIRSIDGESKYWMVAASGHEKGYVLASNVIYKIEEDYKSQVEWYKESRIGGQLSLQFIEPSEEEILQEKAEQLEEAILDKCRGKTMTRLEIHALLLSNGWFGLISSTHVNKALKALTQQKLATANSTLLSDDYTKFLIA